MGKYFTVKELCNSNTAKVKRINNNPNEEQKRNLEALIDNILDPLREAFGKPINVSSGFRSYQLNRAVGGAAASQHCFDEKTEILTKCGWKKYNEIKEGDSIFTYSIEKERIEIQSINEIISYHHKGNMIHIRNKGIDICVTDGHRMLIRYDNHKYKRKNTRNISISGQEYFDSLKTENDKYHIETAKDVFGKRRFYMSASNSNGYMKDYLNLDMLKISMAVISDGCICKKKSSLSGIVFHLKKERKINQIILLLNKLNIPYKTRTRKSDGAFCIWINGTNSKHIYELIGDNKIIPIWILLLSSSQIKELIYEYAFYDGHFDKRDRCSSFSIITTNEANKNVLQSMCVLSGMRCIVSVKEPSTYSIRGKCGKSKQFYRLNIVHSRNEIRANENDYFIEYYDGVVWCANNVNTTVIVRRNGKVSILGNCLGQAADIYCTNKPDNKKLFDLAQSLKLPFDQLIYEKGNDSYPDWVHVSYSPRNRRQVLRIK